MLIKILLIIFLIGVAGSIVTGIMVSYHFKKFKLPFDPKGKKILKIYTTGIVVILFLALVFLVLAAVGA